MKLNRLLNLCTVLALIVGCQSETDIVPEDGICSIYLDTGDLIITELMASPSAIDSDWGWIEVYNNTTRDISLDCVTLVVSDADSETGEAQYALTGGKIEPRAYYVISGPTKGEKPAHVDYQHQGGTSLNPAAGLVSLRSGSLLVDNMVYTEMRPGVAQGYNGLLTPSSSGNDVLKNWCEAMSPYGQDAYGSPGTANEGCSEVGHTCSSDDGVREIMFPSAGDLVITEVLPDPTMVSDAEGEWFEVTVMSEVDLNGLGIGIAGGDSPEILDSNQCLHFAMGEVILFVRNTDATVNGGLIGADFEFAFSLTNGESRLELTLGDLLLDAVIWPDSVPSGVALSLDPSYSDPQNNDLESSWCNASVAYSTGGDTGTPGQPNPPCAEVVTEGTCLDGETVRAIVSPQPGGIRINEFMANPAAVEDKYGEWIEIAVDHDADLNGLVAGTITTDGTVTSSGTLVSDACMRVSAGSLILLARSGDPAANGGLPEVDFQLESSISNSGGGIFLALGDQQLDTVRYEGSEVDSGVSRMRNAKGSEAEPIWCSATVSYGAGDLGTPAEANPACTSEPVTETPEEPTPTASPAPEVGLCLDGDLQRAIVHPTEGSIRINEFSANPVAADDKVGEWIELAVDQDVDLNGLVVGSLDYVSGSVKSSLTFGGDVCLPARAGSVILLARSAEPTVNGGLPEVEAVFTFSLVNSDGGLFVAIGDLRLDTVLYAGDDLAAGASRMRSDEAQSSASTSWCTSSQPYGAGDLGTPAAPNGFCMQ